MSKSIISTITIDNSFISVFSQTEFPQHERGGMILTDRIEALNLRLRESAPGYATDWHVAGDPTLIIVQQGTIRITLRNGSFQDFSTGDMFIAQDYLPPHLKFGVSHGHKAAVIGDQWFHAVHIKLSSL